MYAQRIASPRPQAKGFEMSAYIDGSRAVGRVSKR